MILVVYCCDFNVRYTYYYICMYNLYTKNHTSALGTLEAYALFKDWSFLILYYIFRKKVAENERLNILALPEVQSDIIHFLLYTYFLKDIVHSWYIIFCSLMLCTDCLFLLLY